MERTQGSVIELIELHKRKEIIWYPKHPMHLNKSSDYYLILNFFHKPQIIILSTQRSSTSVKAGKIPRLRPLSCS
jgi:hypothetical protein